MKSPLISTKSSIAAGWNSIKSYGRVVLASVALSVGATASATPLDSVSGSTCQGEFINPITGICWSCVLPIGISSIFYKGNQDGTKDLTGWRRYLCNCNLYVGVPISFYEPARMVDVTTKPYCMVGLGGIKMGEAGAFDGDSAGFVGDEAGYGNDKQVYQAHYYVNPIMYLISKSMEGNSKCFESGGFDVGYITEVDPSWLSAEYANLMSPDAFLYSSLPAVAACTGDCVASVASFGLAPLHWCVGCNGLTYPMTGVIDGNTSTLEGSGVIMSRLLNKLHRTGISLSYYGNDGLCGGYRQLMMNKRQYKYSMTFPVPQTKSVAGALADNLTGMDSGGKGVAESVVDSLDTLSNLDKSGKQCCQPLGRSTWLWGAGRYFPVKGEDFNFQLFRKRDCCQNVAGVGN